MKEISRSEFKALEDAGLIVETSKFRNFNKTCSKKCSKRGKCYVEETPNIMRFLKELNKI